MKYILILLMALLTSNISEAAMAKENKQETAIFAGGCFWCMEKPFDHLDGVISTLSGYTGGHVIDPTYEQVSVGGTGHFEAMQVIYDPTKIDYKTLLDTFWLNIDPLDNNGQFCDKGEQYKSAIFYQNDEEKAIAEKSLEEIAKKLGAKIATTIVKASKFYPAEEYHQDYYQKNPIRYYFYRGRCGRDERLQELWGDKD
jgi:peptide-methionine (S)-S-oxide reductase